MAEQFRGYAHRIDITAQAERVWGSLTQTSRLTRWCSPKAQIRPQAGGLFRASVDRVVELDAHIDVFDPSRRMRLLYMPVAGLPTTQSVLVDDFILEPGEDGTILRLLGSGYPALPQWDVPYLRLRTGWQQALSRLKVFIEKQMDREPS